MSKKKNRAGNRAKTPGSGAWKITYKKFKPAQEGLREALCTLGNGYFGTRGAATESSASRIHYPGTYIAGLYNKLSTFIAGKTVYNEDLVNCPNWLFLTFRIGNGEWITPSTSKILSYHQELDIKRGIFIRKISLQDRQGRRTTIETRRIVHMARPHCAAISYEITPENYEGWIVIRSALDGTVQNTGVARYRQLNSKHLKPDALGHFGKNGIYLAVKTSQSRVRIAQASSLRIFIDKKEKKAVSRILTKEKKGICQDFRIFTGKKNRVVVEKNISIYTSKDKGVKNPLSAAINSVKKAGRFSELLKTHIRSWSALWKKADIQIDGDTFTQQVIRLHAFHLFQTASQHNVSIDAGLPARGLHGEAYRGHIFWDELYAMPFFDFHVPEISKALLLYRYRRLQNARKYARENRYKGAMFPWQSGSTGEEETQVIHLNPLSGQWGADHSRIQRHVSFAIAYNTWKYWERTRDRDFFNKYGAELILSIAQFGASLAKYNPADGKYHTKGVMGPDEFHEKLPKAPKPGFKDNAYTNVLIAWTLGRGLETADILSKKRKERLFRKLGITQKELNRWDDISRHMNLIINNDGIISQFDGYFSLKEINWDAYKKKYDNIQRMDRILKAEGKSPNDYKVSKQADVLMLFYLFTLPEIKELFTRLGYKINRAILKKNYDYYVRRTSHGSTLSKVVHCYVANMIGRSKEAWGWFQEVLKSDINDIQGGTTPEGIHAGVMGGSIDIVLRGYAGVHIAGDRVKLTPSLPRAWNRMSFDICHRGENISFQITKHSAAILLHGDRRRKVSIEINGKEKICTGGKIYRMVLNNK